MKEAILDFFHQYPQLAVVSGFLIAFFVTLIGLIPSVFVTAANVLFFGFAEGLALTFVGENCGSALAFYLYRKGFKKNLAPQLEKYKAMRALLTAENKKAFWLIFSMRLVPLVPSGLVTFTASMGRAGFLTFIIANALGKFPSLLLEAFAVEEVREFGWEGKLIVGLVAAAAVYFLIKQIKGPKKEANL